MGGVKIMEMTDLWSSVLTFGIGFIGFVLRGYVVELSRLRILLNRTREDYVTKADSNQVLSQIMSKFDRIEEKLDRLVERK
jgi:tRNA(Phe) wybutosine-synthesizing methylase Tyw3